MNVPAVRELVELAKRQRLVELYYRKGVTTASAHARLVEPYNFTQGKQDVMVRCFQCAPEEGWRFFMLHKIDRVSDAGADFIPRARIRLQTGEILPTFKEEPVWTPELQAYRDMVSDALADGRVTRDERRHIERLVIEYAISLEQRRFVHASIFHRCLGAVLDDGVVNIEERKQLEFLNRVLRALGWSVADG